MNNDLNKMNSYLNNVDSKKSNSIGYQKVNTGASNINNFKFNNIEDKTKDYIPKTTRGNESADLYYDTIEQAEQDGLENPTKIITESNNWMLSNESLKNWQFGGYQGALDIDCGDWLKDKKINEIIKSYYPEATEEDMELLFYKINMTGCGYVAAVNSLFMGYAEKYQFDFEARFGIKPYKIVTGDNQEKTRDYNYEYLLVDFYLYWAKNKKEFTKIEDALGNIAEHKEINEYGEDQALSENELGYTGMGGTKISTICEVMNEYLESKGIDAYARQLIKSSSNDAGYNNIIEIQSDEMKKYMQEIKGNIFYDQSTKTAHPADDLTSILTGDNTVIVDADKFSLYYPYDLDGNGVLDDSFRDDIGAHVMTVVGITEDPSKIVVSSWGMEFIMDTSSIKDIAVINYNGANDEFEKQVMYMKNRTLDDRLKPNFN